MQTYQAAWLSSGNGFLASAAQMTPIAGVGPQLWQKQHCAQQPSQPETMGFAALIVDSPRHVRLTPIPRLPVSEIQGKCHGTEFSLPLPLNLLCQGTFEGCFGACIWLGSFLRLIYQHVAAAALHSWSRLSHTNITRVRDWTPSAQSWLAISWRRCQKASNVRLSPSQSEALAVLDVPALVWMSISIKSS